MTLSSTSPFHLPQWMPLDVPSVLSGGCTAMDAGEWAEAEPRQDGGPEGGGAPPLVVWETRSFLGG